jgi:hypothetical protein
MVISEDQDPDPVPDFWIRIQPTTVRIAKRTRFRNTAITPSLYCILSV